LSRHSYSKRHLPQQQHPGQIRAYGGISHSHMAAYGIAISHMVNGCLDRALQHNGQFHCCMRQGWP
jgi:hypothetical protein